jgi:hypothetical protein
MSRVKTFPFQLEDFNEEQKCFISKLEKLSYKPGTLFYVNPGEEPKLVNLHVRLDVKHLKIPGKTIQIKGREITLNIDNLDLNLIFDLIVELEIHEAKEWFKFNKVCVTDPHPELNAEV